MLDYEYLIELHRDCPKSLLTQEYKPSRTTNLLNIKQH